MTTPTLHGAPELPELLRNFARAVERIAFEMPPPNPYTPRLAQMAGDAIAELNRRVQVPLTDEQAVKIGLDSGFRGMPSTFVRFARVIEAAHGILPTGAPNERWAVFCDKCGKTWSVPHYHAGKDRCDACRAMEPHPDAPTSQINPGPAPREDGHG